MEQPQNARRLCVLVAIDMAGYSGRAEADEAAAVGLVAELSKLVSETTEALGGRVFNTAGDGFMLEFPTATGAISAAEVIVISAPAPVRVGVHLGEVAVAPGGDLLGHGVNVAARLQQAADPGEVMVSDDVRRALRGPLVERLEPIGRMRLSKMKEERTVYSLKPAGGPKRAAAARPPIQWAAVLAGLAVLAATGFAVWRMAPQPAATADPLMVAVRSFKADGPGAPGAGFGEGVADRLTAALAERQTPVVSREKVKGGDLADARLVVGGGVERDGPLLRVRVQIDDARAGRSLWSIAYERPAEEGAALQDETATNVADIIAGARQNLGPEARGARPEVLAASLTAVETGRRSRGNPEATLEAFRRLVTLTPKSSRAHAIYARVLANSPALRTAPPETAARMKAEAVAEARKALELSPHDGLAYSALYGFLPPRDYLGREALLTKALAAAPDDPTLRDLQGQHLQAVGRLAEGLTITQQALPSDLLLPSRLATSIFALAGAGRYAEAEAQGQRAARLMPTNNSIRTANLLPALLYATPDKASAAIDLYQSREPRLEPAAEKAWRAFVAARAGKLNAAAAVKALTAAPRSQNGVDPTTAVGAYAMMGDVDAAFAEIDKALAENLQIYPHDFFEPPTIALRRDARFMPLMARLGLADYWIKSGHWPDFCRDPSLPYDCRAAAEPASKAAQAKS